MHHQGAGVSFRQHHCHWPHNERYLGGVLPVDAVKDTRCKEPAPVGASLVVENTTLDCVVQLGTIRLHRRSLCGITLRRRRLPRRKIILLPCWPGEKGSGQKRRQRREHSPISPLAAYRCTQCRPSARAESGQRGSARRIWAHAQRGWPWWPKCSATTSRCHARQSSPDSRRRCCCRDAPCCSSGPCSCSFPPPPGCTSRYGQESSLLWTSGARERVDPNTRDRHVNPSTHRRVACRRPARRPGSRQSRRRE